jgi:hypothetical protein
MKETRKMGMVFVGMYNPRKSQVQTPAVVQNKEWSFHVRLYNGCYVGLHNIYNSKALNIHHVCVCVCVCLGLFSVTINYIQ